MSPDNQGRCLRALIDKVAVDEDRGTRLFDLLMLAADLQEQVLVGSAHSHLSQLC